MQNEIVERFEPGRLCPPTSAVGGALKEFRELAAQRRELIFYNSRLDGLVRCVEEIGHKTYELFEDRDDRLIYHSVTLDEDQKTNQRSSKFKDTYAVESMGELPIRKMTRKFAPNPAVPPDNDIHKICFFLAEGRIRVDMHREPGKLTFKSITYVNEDGTPRQLLKDGPQPTQAEAQRLLQMQSICREGLQDSHSKTHVELNQRRMEENSIRASRFAQAGRKRDLVRWAVARKSLSRPCTTWHAKTLGWMPYAWALKKRSRRRQQLKLTSSLRTSWILSTRTRTPSP